MSALTKIPGIAQLASFIAVTFSIKTNPTLRRYNEALSQIFYNHGRLCASNQATVMVLVIVFVGIISYPGIITSYNSSTYARQKLAMTSLSIRNLSLPSWHAEPQDSVNSWQKHHRYNFEGNLDPFWAHRIVKPTWTQDQDIFSRNLPSTEPLHYIAPIVINATDLLSSSDNSKSNLTSIVQSPLSIIDLLVYSLQIQRRIESIVVEYTPEDKFQVENDRGTAKSSPKASRLVSIRDICVLDNTLARGGQEKVPEVDEDGDSHSTIHNCLIHSPLKYWDYNLDTIRTDPDIQGTIHRHKANPLPGTIFGDISFQEESSDERSQTSLVLAYFLRGDLGKHGRHGRRREAILDDEGSMGVPLDVKRVWQLIFSKLASDLQLERKKSESISTDYGAERVLSVGSEGMKTMISAEPDIDQVLAVNLDEGSRKSGELTAEDSHSLFTVGVFSAADTSKSRSTRLVQEESAQPRTNISAEYWLLAMAYFVMFLYISLSVGRVDLVKSKYGLGVAAVATVFVSLLMSIGLCSVSGVTLTLMPWEILPFMIIVVGVENINILVHAVVETSMDLPVKERVGRGLGAVGVSITLTLIAELCLLVVGAMTTIPAVQEFCTFAIAAVIMDYVLQMTFFITVISIDIRRLELLDLSSRPMVPYSRYPFGSRHSSAKSGHLSSELDPSRFGGVQTSSISYKYDDERSRRRNSTISVNSDNERTSNDKRKKTNPKGRIFTSFIIIGVMSYLGYIYGTTNQPITGNPIPITLSYWHIVSPEASSAFWTIVDPRGVGGYLEIEAPVAIVLMKPSNQTFYHTCGETMDFVEGDGCEDQQGWTEGLHGETNSKAVATEGQLDPRRPFKLIRDALMFTCLFALWLIRVFVIPSIILAAAILLLLSYLLSPQRKLLVDLQWRFPFIVLPGDYQSKRKLMMQELMAQEARELGQDPDSSLPLSGTVETLHTGGHRTDIDQMDISFSEGLILTSSIDGKVLLWDGASGHERGIPLAQLEEGIFLRFGESTAAQKSQDRSQKSKSRPAKILKINPSGDFAIASFGEGSIHVWGLATVLHQSFRHGDDRVLTLSSSLELKRESEAATEASKVKVGAACFSDYAHTKTTSSDKRNADLLVGYRDGQIWEWSLLTGRGVCIIESKHRGGIVDMMVVELEAKTRHELGIDFRTYLIVVGRDGGVQCWTTKNGDMVSPKVWTLQWSHSGPGNGINISSLTLDAEVPMAVTGYSNGAIKVWDLEHGNLVWTLSKGSHFNMGSNYTSRFTNTSLPSHQGAITKLCFHALELEDGLTGEPAPRIWLIISSSSDEIVMVWMVEWEGLMRVASPPDNSTYTRTDSLAPMPTENRPSFMSNPAVTEQRSIATGTLRNFNTLSTSLPAPRLVGFMKQRGGKSMTVSDSCLYGVRRVEPSAKLANDRFSSTTHSSVLSSMGAGSNFIRRRKTDPYSPASPLALDQMAASTGGAVKRGWELWEADLYQCIFKDPGVWGMDLTVRTINLQPHHEASQVTGSQGFGMDRRPSKHCHVKSVDDGITGSVVNMINTNGSSMAMPTSPDMRPKLQRKPSSYSHQSPQWGYVYTTSSGSNQTPLQSQGTPTDHSQRLYSVQPGRTDIMRGDSHNGNDYQVEDAEPYLLPFVETKLVYSLSRRVGSQLRYGSVDQGKDQDLKDIIIGFGNFVKIVRLQDEEGDDEDLLNRSGSM